MATKRQKRQAALEKREKFEAEMRRTGLEAQRKDREARRRKELEEWEENHNKRHSWKKRIKECPHCRIELRAAEKAADQVAS